MELLHFVERYLRRTGTPPTKFGREAVRDPRFVLDLRLGREPGPDISRRVVDYVARREAGAGP